MDRVKITEVCNIEIGKTPSRSDKTLWGKGSNWVSIKDIKKKYIYDTKEEITLKAINVTGIKVVPKNTVIMSFKLSVGKVAITGKDMYTNEAIAAFHILDQKKLYFKYLYYALQVLRLTDNTDRAVMGLTLNKQKLKRLCIYLPPLETQKKIVEVLDKAQSLIDARKEQIRLMDELVQSVFYEMFGDPVTNPKGWEKKELGEYLKFLTSGSRGWAKYYSNSGEKFIRIQNVKRGQLDFKNTQYVIVPNTKEALRTRVEENDLILSITADLGRTAVVGKRIADEGAYINQHLCLLRLKDEINPYYVSAYIESEAGKLQIKQYNQVGVKSGLNFKAIKSLIILSPPLYLQKQFVAKINQIESKKTVIKESLIELEINFNSIMQKAFRGELFGGE